jgi:hypothetical protein
MKIFGELKNLVMQMCKDCTTIPIANNNYMNCFVMLKEFLIDMHDAIAFRSCPKSINICSKLK